MPCDIYPRPAGLDVDYGTPTELCHETADNSREFVRQWTKVDNHGQLQCRHPRLVMKP